ncbi:Hypothetical predicted protein [Xyrichtys novacula]|uniref:Secreted protein n=1 Tax=Xyrichtys novacula TaxID=13765 RepID=A0AAV1FFE1_XYRNO|nr:Hypothetical predicted protein [Xyrichtys novacula]
MLHLAAWVCASWSVMETHKHIKAAIFPPSVTVPPPQRLESESTSSYFHFERSELIIVSEGVYSSCSLADVILTTPAVKAAECCVTIAASGLLHPSSLDAQTPQSPSGCFIIIIFLSFT